MTRWHVLPRLALLTSPVAGAADPVLARLDPAWAELERKTIRRLGSAGQRQRVDMAYADIATDACSGLSLNSTAMAAAFDRLAAGARTPDGASRERDMLVYFGVYTGLLLAESFLDKPAFCRGVDRWRQRTDGPRQYWLPR